jgi:hypothetical protein
VGKHLRRDVAGNRHDGLIARLRLGKLGDSVMPQIVKAQACNRALGLLDVGPAFLIATRFCGLLEFTAHWTLEALVSFRQAERQLSR